MIPKGRESLCFTYDAWVSKPKESDRLRARRAAEAEANLVLVVLPKGYRVEKDAVLNEETPRLVGTDEALRLLAAAAEVT